MNELIQQEKNIWPQAIDFLKENGYVLVGIADMEYRHHRYTWREVSILPGCGWLRGVFARHNLNVEDVHIKHLSGKGYVMNAHFTKDRAVVEVPLYKTTDGYMRYAYLKRAKNLPIPTWEEVVHKVAGW